MKNCLKSHKLKTRSASLEQGLPHTGSGEMFASNLFSGAVLPNFALKLTFLVPWHKDLEKRTTENQDQELAAPWQTYIPTFVTISVTLENFPRASKFNSECIIHIFKGTIKSKAPAPLSGLSNQCLESSAVNPAFYLSCHVYTSHIFHSGHKCTHLPITHPGRS